MLLESQVRDKLEQAQSELSLSEARADEETSMLRSTVQRLKCQLKSCMNHLETNKTCLSKAIDDLASSTSSLEEIKANLQVSDQYYLLANKAIEKQNGAIRSTDKASAKLEKEKTDLPDALSLLNRVDLETSKELSELQTNHAEMMRDSVLKVSGLKSELATISKLIKAKTSNLESLEETLATQKRSFELKNTMNENDIQRLEAEKHHLSNCISDMRKLVDSLHQSDAQLKLDVDNLRISNFICLFCCVSNGPCLPQ